MIALLALAALVSASEPVSVIGTVRLTRAVGAPQVSVRTAEGVETVLVGELVTEVQALQSAKLEVVGVRDDRRLLVQHYRILELQGGVKPLVGILVEVASGLAIKDGDGAPLPLSLAPKVKQKLVDKVGAKVWVAGEPEDGKALSGEIKVTRFGILREPPRAPAAVENEPLRP